MEFSPRKLVLQGSHEQIGAQHGEELKDQIVELISDREAILFAMSPGLSPDFLNELCSTAAVAVRKYTPAVYREISATARAINRPVGQLIIAGGYTDLLDVASSIHETEISECSIGILPKHCAIFGTWDSHYSASKSLVLLERRLDNGEASLALTTAGWPAQQGVNSHGIAFAITNLTPVRAVADGLNYIAANAYLADSSSIEDFIKFSEYVSFGSGHSYAIVDDNNAGAIIETTWEAVDVVKSSSFMPKTNHYHLQSKIDDNSRYRFLAGSIARAKELSELSDNIISPDTFKRAILQSQYINKNDPCQLAYTCAHFYIDAKNRELWCAGGPATGNIFEKHSLN